MTPKATLRLVYIAGFGRSGSTLVERTLGAIPRWVNVGELIQLFRLPAAAEELCGCGTLFQECAFWSQVGDRAFGGWSGETLEEIRALQQQVARQRFLPRLLLTGDHKDSRFAASLRDYGAAYQQLYAAVAEVADADVIVDASKWPAQALALHRATPIPVSLLHLVRDARGVAYSWRKSSVHRPHGGSGNSVMASLSISATARQWVTCQTEIELIRPLFKDSARMRYEDFVRNPRTELESTQSALGLSLSSDDLEHISAHSLQLPTSHGVAGNPSRFAHGLIAVRPDHQWTQDFSRRDRQVVTAITAPWLVGYGYPVKRAPEKHEPALTAPLQPPQHVDWPLVDVVIPTRGRPELVREAVQSVVDQDYAGSIRVFVVHDHEEPETSLAALSRPDRTVMPLPNTRTEGLAATRNVGLDHVSADYIASCDDDDTWDPDKLSQQMTRMLADPDLAVLGAGIRLLMSPEHSVDWPGKSPDITRAQLLRSRHKELHSSTLLIRRHVFDTVGRYDENLPGGYAEDYEFLLRAVKAGRVGVVNQPLASIRQYNTSWFRERAEVVAEALEYLLAKHPEIAESKAGHARVLGQIAFARSSLGDRKGAVSMAAKAFRRWPYAPHAALALTHAGTGIEPTKLLAVVRKAGRGIT